MEAFVDNIWSTPSTLHFRIVVVTSARHRVYKQECHVDLEQLAAVDFDHMQVRRNGPDPTRDPQQGTLFAETTVPEDWA